MLYGLAGSAGVGKTTLAKDVAEALAITYLPTSITACALKHGFDPVAPMTLSDRIRLQEHLLADHIEMITEAERPLIVDRTPIDMIGYLMAEFTMHSHMLVSPEELTQVDAYVGKALQATQAHYDFVFLVGQLDHYEVAATRPADNRAYQTHSQLVMEGALSRLRDRVNSAWVRTTDRAERCEAVSDVIVKRMDSIETLRRSSQHIH